MGYLKTLRFMLLSYPKLRLHFFKTKLNNSNVLLKNQHWYYSITRWVKLSFEPKPS